MVRCKAFSPKKSFEETTPASEEFFQFTQAVDPGQMGVMGSRNGRADLGTQPAIGAGIDCDKIFYGVIQIGHISLAYISLYPPESIFRLLHPHE